MLMKNFAVKGRIPLMLIASGALSSLPLIFNSLGFLQWIALIPAFLALVWSVDNERVRLRGLYGRGLIFYWSYYAVTLHWFFYMYPLDFAGLNNAASLVVVLVACFGLSLLQASMGAFAFVLFGVAARTDIAKKHRFFLPFIGASVFVLAEWWLTQGWWGVPWGRTPLGQMASPIFVRSSALFGSYFVTFIIVAVNFCIAYAIINRSFKRIAFATAIGLFSLNLALGAMVTLTYREEGSAVTVAAAQGNISSSDKWNSNSLETTLEIYKELTERAAADGADIIVWPETALPYVLMNSEGLSAFVKELAVENDITIIVSAFTENEGVDNLSNSMIEVRPDGSFGEKIYSKQRLVPFGEFVPMREIVMFLIPPLANVGMLDDDLLAGEECVVLDTDVGSIGCGVCFDSIYESVILGSVRNGAEIIAISTNDSWFSDSAALYMHNSQSRLRAIETGRYVVRSANTGISSIIDPMGNVKEELGALERGYVVSEAYMRQSTTLYTVIGNAFVLLCGAFVSFFIFGKLYFAIKTRFLKNS